MVQYYIDEVPWTDDDWQAITDELCDELANKDDLIEFMSLNMQEAYNILFSLQNDLQKLPYVEDEEIIARINNAMEALRGR